MALLIEKLGRSLKFPFPSRLDDRHHNSDAMSASLRDFQSKISDFISQVLLKHEPESEFLSLTGFQKCFELIHITSRALAKLVLEIDYPMKRWGWKITDEYLSYTLNLMGLLNAVKSSVSHLSQAKISILYALSLIKNSPSSAAVHLDKISGTNLGREFKLRRPIMIEEKPDSDEERAALQALIVSKKIGFLAIGLVVSGLCSDAKPYMEIRKFAGGFDDSLIKDLDTKFCQELRGLAMEEAREVNSATDRVSTAIYTGMYAHHVEELKKRLKVLENSIEVVEKKANGLFSEVLATRNKLMHNIRLSAVVDQ